MDIAFNIESVDQSLKTEIQNKIDNKTKPNGALGVLEEIALQIALIQKTTTPVLNNPHVLVFAGDHGIVEESVSAYPQEVTWQMVTNFMQGGAAINVFCRQHGITLFVIDAGVNYNFSITGTKVIQNKVSMGTANFSRQPAMSIEQAELSIEKGSQVVRDIFFTGCNVVGFGEMGIGNTSSASVIVSLICGIPIEQCVGRGTGLDDKAFEHKVNVLRAALLAHDKPDTPLKVLATFGGFEIAQIVGGMLQAAVCGMTILVDGFIATSAYVIAQAINPALRHYCIFCHESQEQGHKLVLNHLRVKPLLDLKMRLGEGTGAAVAYPIIQSAVLFMNEMASFQSANVSTKA